MATGPYYTFDKYNIAFDTSSEYFYREKERHFVRDAEDPTKSYVKYWNLLEKHSEKYYLTDNDYNYVFNLRCNWDPVWYEYSIKNIYVSKIQVEYMDGTSETFLNPPIWEKIFWNAGL